MKVLVFAPHNDDEVLGVGGTIAKHVANGDEVYVCEVTIGKNEERAKLIKEEALKAHEVLGVKETFFLDFPVVRLSTIPAIELNKEVHKVVQEVKPEIAYIPHKGDMHKDHAVVAESAMVALRPVDSPQVKEIYVYETLSETEWNIPSVDNLFIPNVYVDITETIDRKLTAMKCYQSQLYDFPHPRSLQAIQSLSELRGSTICVENAESFMLVRNIK